MKTAWYISTKKPLLPALLIKIESEGTTLCCLSPLLALKFESKEKADEFIVNNNLTKHWKSLEI